MPLPDTIRILPRTRDIPGSIPMPEDNTLIETVICLAIDLNIYNRFMASPPNVKLSKLQKFILLQTAKDEAAAKALRTHLKLSTEPLTPTELADSFGCRTTVLLEFFKLKWRKCCGGMDSNQIDAQSDPKRYNRANAAFYRSLRRLEARGLIRRMHKHSVDWSRGDVPGGFILTDEGKAIVKAEEKNPSAGRGC